jgi:alpha-1,3-glucosyltransferase
MPAWHVAEGFLSPPQSKPDLWVVINVGIGAVGFGICYLWCLWSLVMESGIVDISKAERKKVNAQGVSIGRDIPN